MIKTRIDITEETMPGIDNMDRAWMTDFLEVFTDCIIGTDENYNITNIRRKPDSTFAMAGILGRSFIDIAVEKEREFVAGELEMLKATDVTHKRFSFQTETGRYYRWTLIARYDGEAFAGISGVAIDITEQTLKEITLNWQRAIIEGSDDFISIADLDGNELYTNPGAYKMTGYGPSAPLVPERIYAPAHFEAVKGEGLEITAGSGSWAGIGELVCADGSLIPVEHRMYSVKNEQDEAILIATTIRDITDFVERDKTMRLEQRRAELLASVAMSFSLSDDFDSSINGALAAISSFMNIDAMFIYRNDRERQLFVRDYMWASNPKYSISPGEEVPTVDAETGERVREYTLLKDMPILVVDDMSTLESALFSKVRGAGIKSMICLPIHVDDKFWGFIGINMYKENRKWLDRDVRFLTTVCGILSTSLEKRLMSQRWQAAQADLQAVVSNYPGIIWSVNADRRFTLYDGTFLLVSGNAPSAIVGQNMHDYAKNHPGVLNPSIPEKVELTFSGEPQDWMMEFQGAVFRCNTMPIQDVKGEITGVVGASVDVTSLIQMQMDLEEARKAAEAANVAKSEFLSRMSHEIRTPMNAIIGMTHIAKSSGDQARIDNCLDKIDNASRHLLALINDILDISKIEANKLALRNEAFDLLNCIQNIRNIINVKADEKNQFFSMNYSESLPRFLIGDELRFTQVIINLLSNAIKFTPEKGSISLDIDKSGQEGDDCILLVRVTDSGIGVMPEKQGKLFTPFEQGDGSITREYGGTGLGLAISKYIVELMGGSIWLKSAAGKGSVFSFTAKMRIGEAPASEKARETAVFDAADLSRFTLLLVEDVEINREIVSAVLEDTHINIEFAENGAIAVDMFASSPGKYDIILMDMQMPVMDGLEATRRIRALGTGKARDIAIVAMTANVFKEDVDKCRAAGMNDHISKPIDSALLLEKLLVYLF